MSTDPRNASTVQAQHRKRLEQIRDDSIGVAGTAAKISQAMVQALEQGGTVNIQPQIQFLTGAYARILKDFGVVEHLQYLGATQKKPTALR